MKLLEDKRFYVYVYLDTRKSGKYKYGEYEFDYEPFYIGKGLDKQYIRHMKEIKDERIKTYKTNKIRKILKLGFHPDIIKVKTFLTEKQAFSLEKLLIMLIGRSCLNMGPLTNIHKGGCGGRMPPHIIEIIRQKKIGQRHSIATIKRMSESHKGILHGPMSSNHKQKLSVSMASMWEDEEYRTKTIKGIRMVDKSGKNHPMFGKNHSLKSRKKMSDSKLGKTTSDKQKETARKMMIERNPNYKDISLDEIKRQLELTFTYEQFARNLGMTRQGLMYKLERKIGVYKYNDVKKYFRENELDE